MVLKHDLKIGRYIPSSQKGLAALRYDLMAGRYTFGPN